MNSLILEYAVLGLASGGVYGLVALGFVVIFRASKVFNFAMGEMMMVSAYIFYAADAVLGVGLLTSLALALAGSMVVALLIERFALRPMLGRPLIAILMVTFGVGTMLRGVVSLIWGGEPRQVPSLLARDPVFIGEILIPGQIARSFFIALLVVAGLVAFLRYSRAGTALKATAADRTTAYSMGIDVVKVMSLTWVVAAISGGLSGILIANVNGLSPHMGVAAFSVLAVVILGGLDSIAGALVAGLLIGMLESLTSFWLGTEWREVTPYIVVLAVLLFKPTGLFGSSETERI
jgi:branched-chain amino acid transport system permease protein